MAANKDLPTKKNMKVVQKGFKQTEKDKYRRGETNTTADTARAGNIARVSAEAARKKAAKKPTAMGQAAKSHQKGLAKVSGEVAAANKATAMRKAKNTFGIMDQTGAAKGKATARTLKSFKKSN